MLTRLVENDKANFQPHTLCVVAEFEELCGQLKVLLIISILCKPYKAEISLILDITFSFSIIYSPSAKGTGILKLIYKAFQMQDRGFTVTVTGMKVYAYYEIRDMTIRYVSVQSRSEYTKSCVLLMTLAIMVHCINILGYCRLVVQSFMYFCFFSQWVTLLYTTPFFRDKEGGATDHYTCHYNSILGCFWL